MKPTIHTIYTACICLLSSMAMVSCGQDETAGSKETERNDVMQFQIAHPSQQQAAPASRATDTGLRQTTASVCLSAEKMNLCKWVATT